MCIYLLWRRVAAITAAQEAALLAVVQFVERFFFAESSTHEKRGVGIFAVTQLARLCPPDTLPLILSKVTPFK